jgi:pimeloyl-ACP methyl ester carboxylesterase
MDNPIFIIHGNADTTVSFEQWKSVFENHKWEKYFIEIEGANHNSIFSDYWEAFRASLTDFLQGNNLDWEGNYLLFDDIR